MDRSTPRSSGWATLTTLDLICYSHVRWDFVFQRPQHLMSRSARHQRVFFVEEPVRDGDEPALDTNVRGNGVLVLTPHVPPALGPSATTYVLRDLLDEAFARSEIGAHVAWYYTPMALPHTRHLRPAATVYDCMDELANFRGAPTELRTLERELFRRADVVFTGGRSLFEAKRNQHRNVHPYPSSIDSEHFRRARAKQPDPEDQGVIAAPRLGYAGVIDERMDLDLMVALAQRHPEWNLVLVGPVAKTDPEPLMRLDNVHHLGPKPYTHLPAYLAGWDVALLPFANNEATRYVSPTKTPEYLAAGRPVVATPIRDVVTPYGDLGLVSIADGLEAFEERIEWALRAGPEAVPLDAVDAFLARTSWERTWAGMMSHVAAALKVPGSVRASTSGSVTTNVAAADEV